MRGAEASNDGVASQRKGGWPSAWGRQIGKGPHVEKRESGVGVEKVRIEGDGGGGSGGDRPW